ncbi:MAG TPA: tetratricopeptide repeat protein [Terracidiphilus sp.]|jgi:tetratricopeptide (TPR) repeat protein
MSSRIWLSISDVRAVVQRSPIAKSSRLLAAMLAFSAGLASGQVDSTKFLDKSPSQNNVSVNQLLTPNKAQRATEKAREDLIHGRFESAQREAELALDIFPRCAIALDIQGVVNLRRANYAEAAREFQRAIDADPALGAAYLGLGLTYTYQGRFKEALVPLDRAAAFLPSSWTVHFEAALSHLGVGEPDTALKEVTYAERFMGVDPQKRVGVSYLRGVALFQLQGYDAARVELNKALRLDPRGIYSTLARRKLEQLKSMESHQEFELSTARGPF